MPTAALMVQGTGSDVGKSLLVAGLARAFTESGLRVRPFKPQNMSNNAAVTADGGEIGRAQALQAQACRVDSSVDMNPVLLKPESETGSQLIIQGKVAGLVSARDYRAWKPRLMAPVLESFRRLEAHADLVLVEGAGSPAEINLRDHDIANMGFAEAADMPVVLVGDIERGGVLASLVGTWTLLEPTERDRLKGYIVNKFRGDPALFAAAPALIADRIGLDCLGVVPWFAQARSLPAEDSAALDDYHSPRAFGTGLRIIVPRLPRIANFDDLDPLRTEAGVELELIGPGNPLPFDADLILLPGSKSTRGDLAALRVEGWDIDILSHRRRGKPVFGLCGGFQMLGRAIHDPLGLEGPAGSAPGLGLLDIETRLEPEKILTRITGHAIGSGTAVSGYEIHLGRTDGADCDRPLFLVDGQSHGASTADGLVSGCYLHGLFAADRFRAEFLSQLGVFNPGRLNYEMTIEATLDALAAHLARAIDLDRLLTIARSRGC